MLRSRSSRRSCGTIARPALSLIICCFVISPVLAVDRDRLLVVNGLSETLSLIDRAGDSVVVNAMTLGVSPNRIRAGGDELLLVNSVSDDLWVIDPDSLTHLRTVTFPDGDNPWDVAYVADTLCAVSLLVTGEVAFVDQAAETEIGRVTVGKGPEGMLLHSGRLWVANTGFDFGTFLYDPGTVSVIDIAGRTVVATIPVGANPQALAPAPDGMIHVLCTGNYTDRFGIVYVCDPGSLTVTDSLVTGGSPGDIAIGTDGMGYLAAGGWVDSGQVYRYDALTLNVLNGAAHPWRSGLGVMQVIPRLEGGVHAVCFSADEMVEHRPDGTPERSWLIGDGPTAALYLTNRLPGDVNGDGTIDVLDVVGIVNVAFRGAALPPRPGAADGNADCLVNVLDVVRIVNVAFRGAPNDLYWGCVN